MKAILEVCVLVACVMMCQSHPQGYDAARVAAAAINPPEKQYPGDLRPGFDIGKVRIVPDVKAIVTGQDSNNWQGFGSASLGAKVWESDNGRHKLGLGLSVNQARAEFQGFNFKTKPNYGGGLSYQYNFGR